MSWITNYSCIGHGAPYYQPEINAIIDKIENDIDKNNMQNQVDNDEWDFTDSSGVDTDSDGPIYKRESSESEGSVLVDREMPDAYCCAIL